MYVLAQHDVANRIVAAELGQDPSGVVFLSPISRHDRPTLPCDLRYPSLIHLPGAADITKVLKHGRIFRKAGIETGDVNARRMTEAFVEKQPKFLFHVSRRYHGRPCQQELMVFAGSVNDRRIDVVNTRGVFWATFRHGSFP